jgi:large subunit ribosomal protein L9
MARSLKVVFREDVRGVAQAGDVKTVAPGYARNYLFPRELAFLATPGALKQWETERQGILAKAQKLRTDAQGLAQRVEALTLAIPAKVSPEGHLFGSVNRQQILDGLEKAGLSIDKGSLLLDAPIKSVGPTSVVLHLGSGIQATLKINVVPEAQNQNQTVQAS